MVEVTQKAEEEVVVKPIETVKFQEAVKNLSVLVEQSPEPLIRENLELTSDNWTSFQLTEEILKVEGSEELLALFVGLNETSVENHAPNERQLDLVQNMARAMKLEPAEYRVFSLPASYFDRDDLEKVDALADQELKKILLEIYKTRPKMIYSLGANITNFFLKRREKLSVLHGNVVEIRFVNENKEKIFQALVMPLFHPELLIINPNMKRTTWMDLQKSLPYIGKN